MTRPTHTAAQIPDEAVQAVAHALMITTEEAYSVVEAVLPHLSAPCAVEVKKLEWVGAQNQACKDGLWLISIDQLGRKHEVIKTFNGQLGEGWSYRSIWFKDIEQAKAAAQSDFESRILSCVVTKDATLTNEGTKPVDVAAVHEECAQAVENAMLSYNLTDCAGLSDWAAFEKGQESGLKFGAAVRALSAEPAQDVRPLEEWHEDHGNVVWWAWDENRKEWLGEPAYIGTPIDSDWPEYHTHWTPHPMRPAAPTTEAGK